MSTLFILAYLFHKKTTDKPTALKGEQFVVSTYVGLRDFPNANKIHISWGEKSLETQGKDLWINK